MVRVTAPARPDVPGRIEAEFDAAVRRFTGPVRGVGVVLIGVFGVLSLPADRLPEGFALLGLTLVGAVADVASPRAALVPAVVRVVAVCAVQGRLGGGADQWALNVLTTTAITLQWQWSPRVTVPITAALVAVQVFAAGSGGAVPRVVVECACARLAFLLVRRSTRRIDALSARRGALERAEALALDRRRREREYLALLHDTASATFLMVATHGGDLDPAAVAGYARRDLAALTGDPCAPHDHPIDVATSLRAMADGVALDVRVDGGDALVPAFVALALTRAAREALTNVERHAGTGAATLSVRGDGDGVEVTVRDAGRGFDPAGVSGHRRGIRESVVGRMAAVGGTADVTSAAGRGTTVRLRWPDG
ncbi:sensor histidine kinase [Saccharothrix australiensis]|nr:ATP-binding protein [Saccharothrix australiensis]